MVFNTHDPEKHNELGTEVFMVTNGGNDSLADNVRFFLDSRV